MIDAYLLFMFLAIHAIIIYNIILATKYLLKNIKLITQHRKKHQLKETLITNFRKEI